MIQFSLDPDTIAPQENVYSFKVLAQKIGAHEAFVLHQLCLDLRTPDAVVDGMAWVERSLSQLLEEITFLSPRTIRRILSDLEVQGLIRGVRMRTHQFRQVKSYTVLVDAVIELLVS